MYKLLLTDVVVQGHKLATNWKKLKTLQNLILLVMIILE